MTARAQLVTDIMAELMARFEDLSSVTVAQHRPDYINPETLAVIIAATREALVLAEAADLIARSQTEPV